MHTESPNLHRVLAFILTHDLGDVPPAFIDGDGITITSEEVHPDGSVHLVSDYVVNMSQARAVLGY